MLPAELAGRREELDVLGVGARPAALDEREAVLVEHARDAQLVGERERDVLALGAVAEGRVVEDDRSGRWSSSVKGPVGPCGGGSSTRRGRCPAAQAGTGRQIAIRSPIDAGHLLRPDRRGCRRPARPPAAGPASGSRRRARRPPPPRSPRRPRAWPSDQRSIIAADRIVPSGFARSWPAMSGAEPWIGSYRPWRPWAVSRVPSDADGSIPSEPAITAASSDRMSPNRFSVTRTSKRGRPLREDHRRGVHQAVLQRDVREVRVDLLGHLAPQPRRREDVRLVHLGHLAPAAARQLERQRDDPPDLALRVPQGVDGGPALGRSRAARTACRSRGREVSSRTMRQSTPSSSSGLSGEAAISAGWTVIGRRLANRPRPPRRANSACSGRTLASGSSHFGPPTAPRSTASASRQASTSSGRMATP